MKQEKDLAKQLKGKTVAGSGCFWSNPSDVKTDKFMVEAKTTSKDYYILHQSTIRKIVREATQSRMRFPLFVVDIKGKRFVMFRHYDTQMPDLSLYKYFNTNEIYPIFEGGSHKLTLADLNPILKSKLPLAKVYSIANTRNTPQTWFLTDWETFMVCYRDLWGEEL